MRMSAAAQAPQSVRLYLPGDHRLDVASSPAFQEVIFAGPPSEPDAAALGAYLTVVDLHFADPATIDRDLTMAPSSDDATVTPTVVRREALQVIGIPLGWLIVGGGLLMVLALIVAGAVLIARRRADPQPE
jgi:hypothetical protein